MDEKAATNLVGTILEKNICPNCKALLDPTSKFCPNCGKIMIALAVEDEREELR